jgi:hypothetical protein
MARKTAQPIGNKRYTDEEAAEILGVSPEGLKAARTPRRYKMVSRATGKALPKPKSTRKSLTPREQLESRRLKVKAAWAAKVEASEAYLATIEDANVKALLQAAWDVERRRVDAVIYDMDKSMGKAEMIEEEYQRKAAIKAFVRRERDLEINAEGAVDAKLALQRLDAEEKALGDPIPAPFTPAEIRRHQARILGAAHRARLGKASWLEVEKIKTDGPQKGTAAPEAQAVSEETRLKARRALGFTA